VPPVVDQLYVKGPPSLLVAIAVMVENGRPIVTVGGLAEQLISGGCGLASPFGLSWELAERVRMNTTEIASLMGDPYHGSP
jgi:hypothetical protein